MRQRTGDEFVEQVAAAQSPVLEGLREGDAILGGLAERTAYNLRPTVGSVKHSQNVGVPEPYAQCFGEMPNVVRIEGESLGIAEHGAALRNEAAGVERCARAAGDQQRNVIG